MKVTLDAELEADTTLLQQVVHDGCRVEHALSIEVNLYKLSETRRIVVLERLRIAKGFKKGVRVQDLLLDGCVRIAARLLGLGLAGLFVKQVLLGAAEALACPGEVRQDNLGGLRLASATLTRDDDRLIGAIHHQVLVGVLSDHEQVRFRSFSRATGSLCLRKLAVSLRHGCRENVQPLEGIDRE